MNQVRFKRFLNVYFPKMKSSTYALPLKLETTIWICALAAPVGAVSALEAASTQPPVEAV